TLEPHRKKREPLFRVGGRGEDRERGAALLAAFAPRTGAAACAAAPALVSVICGLGAGAGLVAARAPSAASVSRVAGPAVVPPRCDPDWNSIIHEPVRPARRRI